MLLLIYQITYSNRYNIILEGCLWIIKYIIDNQDKTIKLVNECNSIVLVESRYLASENMGLLLTRIAFFVGSIIFIIPPSSQLLRFFSNSSYIPRLKHAVGSFSKSQIFLLFIYSLCNFCSQ